MDRIDWAGMSRRSTASLWRQSGVVAFALAVLSAGGCASRGNVEVLEARLRQSQDEIRSQEKELVKVRKELELAQREMDQLHVTAKTNGQTILPVEHTQSLVRISGLSINRLMSGGKDQNGDACDDAVQVIVTPHDDDGDLVKIAGRMEIEAYDLTRSGDDKRIGIWTFEASEVRKHWHAGFLSSGYQFLLPLSQTPGSKQVLVHARLITADGRQFDTSQSLAVAPSSGDPTIRPPAKLNAQRGEEARSLVTHAQDHSPEQPRQNNSNRSTARSEGPGPDSEGRTARTTTDVEFGESIVVPDPVEIGNTFPVSTAGREPRRASVPAKNSDVRPFPEGLRQTSDNWTDDTIPRVR